MTAPKRPTGSASPTKRWRGGAILLGLLCAAPTVGDVGSCGSEAVALDATSFYAARARLQCRRCGDCALQTAACVRACVLAQNPGDAAALDLGADAGVGVTQWPAECHPVIHDGEVCLRALEAVSCGDFARAVSPSPIVPSECDFCPSRGAP